MNNLHESDCVGNFACWILRWVAHIRDQPVPSVCCENEKRMPDVATIRRVMAHETRRELDKGTKVFELLQQLVNDRDSIAFPSRAIQYFECIFPGASRVVEPAMNPDGRIIVSDTAHQLVESARELVFLKRLFLPPEDWKKENTIFQKERDRAESLLNNPDFINDRSKFLVDYKAKSKEVYWADFKIMDRLERDYEDYGGSPFPGGPAPDDMLAPTKELLCTYDVARLCMHYCIAGFSANAVYPRLFRVCVRNQALYLELPIYLKIDFKRELPGDVLNVMQKRGDPPFSITPGSAESYLNIEQDIDLWLVFVLLASHGLVSNEHVTWIHNQIISIPFLVRLISSKAEVALKLEQLEGCEYVIRQLHRRLERIATLFSAEDLRKVLEDEQSISRLRQKLSADKKTPPFLSGPLEPLEAIRKIDPSWLEKRKKLLKGSLWERFRAVRGAS